MDRADIVNRFWYEFICPADSDAVVPLGLEHAFLEVAGQEKEQGKADTDQCAQPRAQMEYDGEDTENREYVGNHTDHAGIKEVFQRIDVIDEK